MANEKKVVEEEDAPKLFVWSIRSISYAIGWVLIFCLSAFALFSLLLKNVDFLVFFCQPPLSLGLFRNRSTSLAGIHRTTPR
jgi:hypothetical protein